MRSIVTLEHIMDLMADAIMNPSPESMGRLLIQQGIMRAITCPYTHVVLDVSTTVVIDGSDYFKADGTRGKMDIMHFAIWEVLLAKWETKESMEAALGYKFDLHDGRVLFRK